MNTSAVASSLCSASHRLLLLEIEHERALVAVEVGELAGQLTALGAAAERAQQIAARRLDLDDLGAVVGEEQRRGRADHHRGQIDDANAGQRTAAHGMTSTPFVPAKAGIQGTVNPC